MSRENVEAIRGALDAWNRGDWDEALKDAAPDVQLDNSSQLGDWRGVHKGAEEIKRMWETLTELWGSIRFEIDQVVDSDEFVVTRQTAYFRGRDGIEVQARQSWTWAFRDGKAIRLVAFDTFEEALEAAELRE